MGRTIQTHRKTTVAVPCEYPLMPQRLTKRTSGTKYLAKVPGTQYYLVVVWDGAGKAALCQEHGNPFRRCPEEHTDKWTQGSQYYAYYHIDPVWGETTDPRGLPVAPPEGHGVVGRFYRFHIPDRNVYVKVRYENDGSFVCQHWRDVLFCDTCFITPPRGRTTIDDIDFLSETGGERMHVH